MTHLTDYSYLERGTAVLIFGLWSLVHIYTVDKFRVFRLENYFRKDTKTIVTTLLFISMFFSIIYDILGTYAKYEEGFTPKPDGSNCVIKPKSSYNPTNKAVVTASTLFP